MRGLSTREGSLLTTANLRATPGPQALGTDLLGAGDLVSRVKGK